MSVIANVVLIYKPWNNLQHKLFAADYWGVTRWAGGWGSLPWPTRVCSANGTEYESFKTIQLRMVTGDNFAIFLFIATL